MRTHLQRFSPRVGLSLQHILLKYNEIIAAVVTTCMHKLWTENLFECFSYSNGRHAPVPFCFFLYLNREPFRWLGCYSSVFAVIAIRAGHLVDDLSTFTLDMDKGVCLVLV